MVTVAEDLEALYPVDNWRSIVLKGYVNGNWGNFYRSWDKTSSANIKPGMGLIHATGDNGEDTITEWAANSSNGIGVAGWDKTQVSTQQTAYASADLAPYFLFHRNRGMVFQGYVDDSTANLNADYRMKANTTGEFLMQATSGTQYRTYAQMLYYNADTGASYANLLVMYESNMLGQGTSET